jgi:deoxyhypusine synthase
MGSHVPSSVAEAVLVPSEELPKDAKKVTGLNFNRYDGRDITAVEMVEAMAGMGFQASAIGEAARIINDMVKSYCDFRF